jgi:transposase-like protein
MTLEPDRDCPHCDSSSFWRTASTTLHLGEKVKWDCTECGYGFVQINGEVGMEPA